MNVMVMVMVKTIGSDGFDGCDGKFSSLDIKGRIILHSQMDVSCLMIDVLHLDLILRRVLSKIHHSHHRGGDGDIYRTDVLVAINLLVVRWNLEILI